MMPYALFRQFFVVLVCTVTLCACAPLPRLDAGMQDGRDDVTVAGLPNARFYFDGDLQPFVHEVRRLIERQTATAMIQGRTVSPLPPAHVLAISGGGDNGAFGAGLLAGWSATGKRPEFMMVTGVSAGALIAPFAFLGPDYDQVIADVATTLSASDVFRSRSMITGLLSSDGMADSAPLQKIVAHYVTPEVLAAVAREYEKGRYLQISTTDLDSGRAVQWNMGAIAASGAIDLFRRVMVASTSIPGVVSPVMFDVEAGGHHYQEMHVDGGVITQVVTYPTHALDELRKLGVSTDREVHVYVIRNGRVDPEPIRTERSTLSIGARALSQLVQRQGISDLERIYHRAQVDGYDYNVAYIGRDFNCPHRYEFDTQYMQHLFDYAYQRSLHGSPWHKVPPTELEKLPTG